MFTAGNTKLGKIWNWSIPAIKTCPGRTRLCESACYACSGAYRFRSTQDAHARNYRLSLSESFVHGVICELLEKRADIVRIHASGDFYSREYVEKWVEIVRKLPLVTFYGYTRSWRPTEENDEQLIASLFELSCLSNVYLWLSCDRQTGAPPRWWQSPRAYLSGSDDDMPSYPVELIFRDDHSTRMKKGGVNQALVCPFEQGFPRQHLSCQKCALCFDSSRKVLRDFEQKAKRYPKRYRKQLPVIT